MAAATAALKALGIPFKKEKVEQYDPEFVKKIQKSIEEVNAGKTTRIDKANLKEFLGL